MAEQNIAFNIEGMISEDSAQLIKNYLSILNGVIEVIVDINTRRVVVEYDEERLSAGIIREKIEDAGFKVK
ncbi:MAG: heavy-metal-associated domain-containing protein [Clostridiaceae bacterium]|nr:heavy-metal-associated domain-containing protein [Clostridiaceae bacterium]